MNKLANNVYELAERAFEKAEQAGRTQPMPVRGHLKKARRVAGKFQFEQTDTVPVRAQSIRLIRRRLINENSGEGTVYTIQTEDQPKTVVETERVLGFTALLSGQPKELSDGDLLDLRDKLVEAEQAFTK